MNQKQAYKEFRLLWSEAESHDKKATDVRRRMFRLMMEHRLWTHDECKYSSAEAMFTNVFGMHRDTFYAWKREEGYTDERQSNQIKTGLAFAAESKVSENPTVGESSANPNPTRRTAPEYEPAPEPSSRLVTYEDLSRVQYVVGRAQDLMRSLQGGKDALVEEAGLNARANALLIDNLRLLATTAEMVADELEARRPALRSVEAS